MLELHIRADGGPPLATKHLLRVADSASGKVLQCFDSNECFDIGDLTDLSLENDDIGDNEVAADGDMQNLLPPMPPSAGSINPSSWNRARPDSSGSRHSSCTITSFISDSDINLSGSRPYSPISATSVSRLSTCESELMNLFYDAEIVFSAENQQTASSPLKLQPTKTNKSRPATAISIMRLPAGAKPMFIIPKTRPASADQSYQLSMFSTGSATILAHAKDKDVGFKNETANNDSEESSEMKQSNDDAVQEFKSNDNIAAITSSSNSLSLKKTNHTKKLPIRDNHRKPNVQKSYKSNTNGSQMKSRVSSASQSHGTDKIRFHDNYRKAHTRNKQQSSGLRQSRGDIGSNSSSYLDKNLDNDVLEFNSDSADLDKEYKQLHGSASTRYISAHSKTTNPATPIATSRTATRSRNTRSRLTATSKLSKAKPVSPKHLLSNGKQKCTHCNKKLRAALTFKCRCEQLFCASHRYSDTHNCKFDYKAAGRESLIRENPLVKKDKLERL